MESPCPVAIAFQIIEKDLRILLWRYPAVRSGQLRMECTKEGAFRKSFSLDLLSSPLSDSFSFPFLPPPPPSSCFPFPLPLHLPLLPPVTSLPSFFSLHHFIVLLLLLSLLFFDLFSSFPLFFSPYFSLLFFSPLPWSSSAPSPAKQMSLEFRSQNLETERWLKSSRLMGVRGGGQVLLKETYLLLNGHLAGFLCNAFPGQACLWLEESLLVFLPPHSYHPQVWGMVCRRFSNFLREALNKNWDWSPWLLLLCFFLLASHFCKCGPWVSSICITWKSFINAEP